MKVSLNNARTPVPTQQVVPRRFAQASRAKLNEYNKLCPETGERYTPSSKGSHTSGIAVVGHIVKLHVRLSRSLMLLIGCWLFLSVAALAQGVGNAAKVRMQEMDRRELQLSDVSRGKRREADPRWERALMDQVNEDFQRLLKLHNQIVRAITRDDPPDYQFISDATDEIKKRATRLQSTLGLHKPETAETKREGQAMAGQPAKDDLIALCLKIESFITNPIIETPGTVDAQQLERARRDLEDVVEFSGAIKKRAEKQKH